MPPLILRIRLSGPWAGWGAQFDYAAFVQGEDETAAALCSMAVVAFNGAKAYYEEKHDKATFVKNIISDNILLGDIYTQAKELHFLSEAPRAAFLVRQLGPADVSTIDVIQNLFPDKQMDFVISINETDVASSSSCPRVRTQGAPADRQADCHRCHPGTWDQGGYRHRYGGQPHPGSGAGLQGGWGGHRCGQGV